MLKKKFLLIPVVAILLLVTSRFLFKRDGNIVHPEIKNITASVYASGSIISDNEFKLYASADGYITEKLVSDGDTIVAGQSLYRIESAAPDAKFNSAQEAYRVAKGNTEKDSPVLAELSANLASAKDAMQKDSLDLIRYKNLKAQEAVTTIEFEKHELQYKTSVHNYTAALERFEKIKKQLTVEFKNAQSQFVITQTDKDHYTVKSGMNGKVYQLFKEKGELVKKNDLIAIIGDSRHLKLKLNVDEADINRIKTGQVAFVKTDVDGDKIFRAIIVKLYPMMNTADQTFRVDAEFETEYTGNYNGVFAEANILIAEKKDALVIPSSLISGGDSVIVKENRDEKKIKIVKGIENFDYVEVVQGLDKNSKLVKK